MSDPTSVPSLAEPSFWAREDRNQILADLQRNDPVHWTEEPPTTDFPEGGRGFWSLLTYDDVISASRDQETFTSALGSEMVDLDPETQRLFSGMLDMSGEEHARHRAIVNRVLTPRTVADMTETITAYARQCIVRSADRGSCDFMADMTGDFPAQIICELLGVPVEDRTRLITLTVIGLAGNGSDESYRAILDIIEYAKALATRVREAGAGQEASFLNRLMTAEVDGQRFSDEEVAIFFGLLVTAGIETTATAIGQGMLALSRYPDVRRRWLEDFEGLANGVVEEMIRWASPVMHFRRTATRDLELRGRHLRKGDKVVLWYIAANRDPAVFPDPDVLDIDRPSNQHAAFGGGGPHFCLGAVLAREEMKIFFRELFRLLPDIEVTGEPTFVESNFVNALQSLPVTFTPRPDLLAPTA